MSPPVLPEAERRRRQSQSNAARAKVHRGAHPRAGDRHGGFDPATDETLQTMWNTIDNGGYDCMSKGDW